MENNKTCNYLKTIKHNEDYENLLKNLSNFKNNKTWYIYNYILNLYRWSKRLTSDEYPFSLMKILIPIDQQDSSIVIVIDKTNKFSPYNIWMYASINDNDYLVECLKNTPYIDWNQEHILLSAVHEFNLNSILNLVNEKRHKVLEQNVCDMYSLDKDQALNVQYKIPSGISLRKLNVDDVDILAKNWNFTQSGTSKSIELLLQQNSGSKLINENDETIAWILMNEHLASGMLYVADGERGKGYAKLLVSIFSKDFALNFDQNPITFINEDNLASENLFKSLGYEKILPTYWITLG